MRMRFALDGRGHSVLQSSVFYLHDVIAFVEVLRFFREDDWSALLPSTVDFRGTDQIQAVRQPFVVPLESSL